jgi:hypothetical protein
MITGESRLRGRGAGSTSTVISTRILAAVYRESAENSPVWLTRPSVRPQAAAQKLVHIFADDARV